LSGSCAGRLVGDDRDRAAALDHRFEQRHRVRDDADARGTAIASGIGGGGDRLVDATHHTVEIARVDAAPRARLVHLGDETHAAVHRHRERLRAAHAAEPGRQHDATRERAAAVPRRGLGERLERALHDAPASRCRSTSPRSSAVHRETFALELQNCSHVAHLGTSSELAISTRGANACVRNTPTGLPDWTSSVSSPSSRRSVSTMRSNASHERAALPVPP
jgi:hypothetical protein